MSKSSQNGLTGFAGIPVGLRPIDERVLGCSYGHYPWDDWERTALAAGVPKELAGLGRLTMREAYQHDWADKLKSLCGWNGDGRRMVKLALRSPETARKRWQRLLDTDGCLRTATNRGEWVDGEWRPLC